MMVYFMENPMKMDGLRGSPIYGNPHIEPLIKPIKLGYEVLGYMKKILDYEIENGICNHQYVFVKHSKNEGESQTRGRF